MLLTKKKHDLRARVRQRRKEIQNTLHHSNSMRACGFAFEWLETQNHKIIASYSPMGSELQTRTLHQLLLSSGTYHIAFPSIDGIGNARVLKFRTASDEMLFLKGPHGTRVPGPGSECVTPTAVVVPLIAFDKACNRLGQGKGYYDATLKALKAKVPYLKTLGIAFACQEVTVVPTEPHDVILDAIATENGIIYS